MHQYECHDFTGVVQISTSLCEIGSQCCGQEEQCGHQLEGNCTRLVTSHRHDTYMFCVILQIAQKLLICANKRKNYEEVCICITSLQHT